MIIRQSRIRNLKKYFIYIKPNTKIIIGLTDIKRFETKLKKIGFSDSPKSGETLLPSPKFGPVSIYNAQGKSIIHKDRPKETAYRSIIWKWKEWSGRYETVERSKVVDVPYERYPRTFISPPCVEFTIINRDKEDLIVTSPITYNNENQEQILHIINLFLEIFGECLILMDNLQPIINIPLRRVNWTILPSGEMPWDSLKNVLKPILKEIPKGNREINIFRLRSILKNNPDFCAIGQAGFRGYIVFGFNEKNLFIFESLFEGNATYAFRNDWQSLSMLSKAEILNKDLHEARIIHRAHWSINLKDFLKKFSIYY